MVASIEQGPTPESTSGDSAFSTGISGTERRVRDQTIALVAPLFEEEA